MPRIWAGYSLTTSSGMERWPLACIPRWYAVPSATSEKDFAAQLGAANEAQHVGKVAASHGGNLSHRMCRDRYQFTTAPAAATSCHPDHRNASQRLGAARKYAIVYGHGERRGRHFR